MVNPSPWPFVGSFSALTLTTGGVMYMHLYPSGGLVGILGFAMVLLTMFLWWQDVIKESTFEGNHTMCVQEGMRMGMILFITSEVMFFFAFFWAFFASSLSPVIEIGAVWPPKGINIINIYDAPLANTMILLLSGASVTWAHHAICYGHYKQAFLGLAMTIALGIKFTFLQGVEYVELSYTIADSIYGSCFYVPTGFHGLHVLIGTLFLMVCLYRLSQFHFSRQHHFGFEAAAWYWHFVDVVWLFLFTAIYWWGGL